MSSHPVRFHVHASPERDRLQVLIRVALLAALGALGGSSVYWMLYLALPSLVALFILQNGSEWYLGDASARLLRGLRWLAAAYAYLWLLTDEMPSLELEGGAVLEIEPSGTPSPASALGRLLTSLPALAVMIVLSFVAGLFWIAAAIAVLILKRVPAPIDRFMASTLRYQFRLIAYHLSLVDRYPSLYSCAASSADFDDVNGREIV
jgi:uncharacterized protein DUF4389